MFSSYINKTKIVTTVLMCVVLVAVPFIIFASDYTKDDITNLSAEVVDRSDQKWKFDVTFSDGKTDSISIRDIGGKFTLYETVAEELTDKYEFSISDDDVQDIIVFDESDFDDFEETPEAIYTDDSTGIANRWQIEVEYSDATKNTSFYVYDIKTTSDLFEEVAERLDISEDSVKSVIDYDSEVLPDDEPVDTTVRDVIATPDPVVDYKWEIVVVYRDRSVPNKTFIVYGIFSTGDLKRAIKDEIEIEDDVLDEVLDIETREVSDEEEPAEEKEAEEELVEEVEEEEEKEPVIVYKRSDITAVELYAQGTNPESYSIKVVTSDGVTTDVKGVVEEQRSDKDFYDEVARKINTKANFNGLDGIDIDGLSVVVLTDVAQEEKDSETAAITALLLIIIELLSAQDDSELQLELTELLNQID